MGQLHQITLRYHPVEDRALLRVSTQDRSEFRFWLTRRLLQALWPVLIRLLEADERVRRQPRPEIARQVLSFQHEHALQQSDFSTAYRDDPASFPIGEEPLLLSEIQVKQTPHGCQLLCLRGAGGKGAELALKPALLHSLCRLLADTSSKAGWDLDLRVVEAVPDTESGEQRAH